MGIYGSEYTGAEIDKAVGKVLGSKYQEAEDPGCHLIGTDSVNPQNLFEVTIPGKYTIFFYYDMATGDVPINMPFAGNSPIFMQVTYDGEDHHYQRITIGAGLWYRDLNSGNYEWQFIDMGVQQIEIIDNLVSTRIDAALSANMGRELKSIIDNLSIGNLNLLDNSGLMRGSSCWKLSNGVTRETNINLLNRPVFKMDGSVLTTDVESVAAFNEVAHYPVVIPGKIYTASVWVYALTDSKVFISMEYLSEQSDSVESIDSKRFETDISSSDYGKWIRIKVTLESNLNAHFARVVIGVTGRSSVAYFALPKLEDGVYATEWNPSYYDMWCEFDNANFINEEFVNTTDIKDHEGLVYNGTEGEYRNIPVAIGGGGGFINTSDLASGGYDAYTEMLWMQPNALSYSQLKAYDESSKTWMRILNPPLIRNEASPVDTEVGWLDSTYEDNTITATLKYYDSSRKAWRPITARATGIWYFGETAPSDTSLMWIKTPDFVPYLYYTDSWTPLHAIWGKNI